MPSADPATGNAFVCEACQDDLGSEDHARAIIACLIAELDAVLSEQLTLVVRHGQFQALEASWRSLEGTVLAQGSKGGQRLKLLDCTWAELSADLNLASDIRRSGLFRKVYSRELDTAGGEPFGLLLVDHRVSAGASSATGFDDLYTLQLLADLGARSLCPVVSGVDRQFFGDDPLRILHDRSRVSRILDSEDMASWQLLRTIESARFLGLVLPGIRLRTRWQDCFPGFVFSEPADNEGELWGSASWAFVANVMGEFNRISWFGFLRSCDEAGVSGAIVNHPGETGSNRQGIPNYLFSPVADIDLPAEQDTFWAELGFIPLCSIYLSGQLGFFSNQSVYRADCHHNEQVKTMIQTTLMACRFAHYVKVLARDLVGSWDSADECRQLLQNWIQDYVSEVDYGEDVVMARYPLKAANVVLTADPDDQTRYRCEISLLPQYQYDYLDSYIQLATDVVSGKSQ
ncbi:type VI secretion system contractile sheath domain-containing protein [Kistimonas asteriae]|uniref:type VI secretion system contractile sheath domain-containing protein n=1 Tax=Kistimonas asteriae TaxID=517724 RepID=UPI001BA5F2F4|nr:type VI secretion system contractile sheath large subunit [Kistimonas asteriae]